MNRLVAALLLSFLAPATLFAQFSTSPADPSSLVGEVVRGRGIKIRNVKYIGDQRAIARFSNESSRPAFEDGLLLSTGIAAHAVGPNENPKNSTALGSLGDRKMDALANTRTFDAAILEFDFMADRDSITLEFIFASEEYAEHVGSTFADPVAITVSGPNYPVAKNIAVLPGTTTPVNINSVNITENKRFYVDNNPFTLAGKPNPARKAELNQDLLSSFQYDGMTTALAVGLQVTPNQSYRMRIAISDAGDGNYDSALLIKAGSLQSVEQNRHLVARNIARERRTADSLAREQAREDSLDAVLAQQKGEEFERIENTGVDEAEETPPPSDNPVGSEAEDEGYEEITIVEEEPEAEPAPQPKPVMETGDEGITETNASEEERTVLSFEAESYFVPEDQEAVLEEYGQLLKARPDLRLGIYIGPGADKQTTDLRYDMTRLEVLKAGARPDQIYRMAVGGHAAGEAIPTHRAELLLKASE